jgi:P27 family predicted phage terminase small subunit
MKGRKAELKAIDGGLKGAPPAPSHVHPDMIGEWNVIAADMAQRSILTSSMTGLLSTYLTAMWTVRKCQEAIETHGLLVETAHKMMKPNPASGMLSKALESVGRLSAELGLTPAARAKQGFRPEGGQTDDGAPAGLDI